MHWPFRQKRRNSQLSDLESSTSTLVGSGASVSAIPDAILGDIFLLGQKDGFQVERAVSHVCHSWRSIALSRSALWMQVSSCNANVEMISLYLYRSQGNLVDLRIELCANNDWEKVLKFIILPMYRSRWRRISIQAYFSGALEIINEHFCVPFQNLQMLSVLTFDNEITVPVIDEFPQFGQRRKTALTSVRFQTHAVASILPIISLDSLTTFHLEQFGRCPTLSFDVLRRLLQSLPSLRHLSIYGRIVQHWPVLTSKTIFLPQLSSLRIANTESLSSMLSCISVPSISNLILKDFLPADISTYLFRKEMHCWITSDFPSLRSLTLNGRKLALFSSEMLIRLFRCFPSIETLKLVNCVADAPLGLIMKLSPSVLPNIESIYVHRLQNWTSKALLFHHIKVFVHRSITSSQHYPRELTWRTLDSWPPGQPENDPDDSLFSGLATYVDLQSTHPEKKREPSRHNIKKHWRSRRRGKKISLF